MPWEGVWRWTKRENEQFVMFDSLKKPGTNRAVTEAGLACVLKRSFLPHFAGRVVFSFRYVSSASTDHTE